MLNKIRQSEARHQWLQIEYTAYEGKRAREATTEKLGKLLRVCNESSDPDVRSAVVEYHAHKAFEEFLTKEVRRAGLE